MKKKPIIFAFLIILVLANLYNSIIPKNSVVGTYVSNSKEPIVDSPGYGDTLKLLKNNTFQSDTWGNGTYEVTYTLKGTLIKINYKYEFGNAGWSSTIYRPFFVGSHRISVSRDLNYYFRKID